MMQEEFEHKPVLLAACMQALDIKPDGIYVDGTLGRAGHAREIIKRLKDGRLIGLDRDLAAIEAAGRQLAEYKERVTLVHSNFSRIDQVLEELGLAAVDGMLFDLGVSSPQLDDGARGFSYRQDGPLDMRMDKTAALDAWQLVNQWSEKELRHILFSYGEERYAPAIARAIVRSRAKKSIQTTLELVELIRHTMPPAALREKQHPAKRSFQAIRIAVNDELGELAALLEAAAHRLKPGGRLAVITFHSLEDRMVKQSLQKLTVGCTCPAKFPLCVCGKKPLVRWVSKKPLLCTAEELEENPRARSAKLRVAEKCEN